MQVNGFDYVPETLRSLSFIEVAKNIKSVHYAINNFYNEPSAINKLNQMGTKIAKPALQECVGATLMVLIGNSYGHSFDAVTPSLEILDKLSQNDWIYYIEQCLVNDQEVLYKISCGGDRTTHWCEIASKYNLNSLEYSNTKISDFISYSSESDKRNTRASATEYYKKIINQ